MKKFLQIARGVGVKSLLDDKQVSRSGSYKFVKEFIAAGLIKRVAADEGGYKLALTEKGLKLAPIAQALEDQFKKIEEIDEQFRVEDVKREMESLTSFVPLGELEEILKQLRESAPSNPSHQSAETERDTKPERGADAQNLTRASG